MRLIVSYTEGDGCTYSCENSIPFEYESAEKLLLDLEAGAKAWLALNKALYAKWDAFSEKWPSIPDSTKKHDEWSAEFDAYQTACAELTAGKVEKLVVGDSILWFSHFLEDEKFTAPDIYTVDEWFASAGLS